MIQSPSHRLCSLPHSHSVTLLSYYSFICNITSSPEPERTWNTHKDGTKALARKVSPSLRGQEDEEDEEDEEEEEGNEKGGRGGSDR